MDTTEIKKLFDEFRASYEAEKREAIWTEQSKMFREFWRSKILALLHR